MKNKSIIFSFIALICFLSLLKHDNIQAVEITESKNIPTCKIDVDVKESYNYLAQKAFQDISNSFSKLPKEITSKFNKDWSFIICDDLEIRVNRKDENILGYSNFCERKIYIDCRYSDFDETFIHELGHVIQHDLSNLDLSSDFRIIYKKEQYKYLEIYPQTWPQNIQSQSEYYAEACIKYFKDCKKFQKNCPETYAFIDKCVKQYIK